MAENPAARDQPCAHDELFEALADSRRRAALDVVSDADPPVTLSDLAESVAARLAGSDRERVHVSLAHAHVPKLDEYGILDYDAEDGTVAPDRRMPQADSLLTAARSLDIPDDGS